MAQMPMLNDTAFVYKDMQTGMDGDFVHMDDKNAMSEMAEQYDCLQTPLGFEDGFSFNNTVSLDNKYWVNSNRFSGLLAPAGIFGNSAVQPISSAPMASPDTSQGPSLAGSPFSFPPTPLHADLVNNQTPQAFMPVAPDARHAPSNPVTDAPMLSTYVANPQVGQAGMQQDTGFDVSAVCLRSCALLEQDPLRSAVRRELCNHLRDHEGYHCTLVGRDVTNQVIDKYLAGDIKGAHKTYGRQAKKSFSQKNIRAAKKIRKQIESHTGRG